MQSLISHLEFLDFEGVMAMPDYKIVKKEVPTFYFIGVTTTKSSIMKVFPLWMKELGRPEVVIEGIDHKIHDTSEAYRASVAQIKYDPLSLGALVTTHKMDLYAAAQDMFEYFDSYAQVTHEISSISKLDGRLEGHAKDPITVGLSLDAIVTKDYFGRTRGQVLLFGAGGSSVALLLHLMNKKDKEDRPERVIVVNRSQPRLDHLRHMVETQEIDIEVEYILNGDPQRNDAFMESLPESSIVINATGMGKDTPGSPITDAGLFPKNGIAWEFNYRGELDFMHQARRQVKSRRLHVEDGWVYFLHGWTQVVAQVLHRPIEGELFQRLARVAEVVRVQ
jgi:shikimate 5-dehydrogenase